MQVGITNLQQQVAHRVQGFQSLSAIDAALALRERCAPAQRKDAALRIQLSPTAFKIVGEPRANKVALRNIVDGQFSVHFQLATA
ncbi:MULTISPECIES: hypothetical protein [unclassified Variovorax]|uniref:hypothetical protein n=1 Tax=unclassified Variovorax TaxID=663243 RepID=UPI003F44DA33